MKRALQAVPGTAADNLADAPSVAVDMDGNVSLRGDSNVAILVDGKPSAAFSGSNKGFSLRQFPASEIDRVEAMTTPPAKYRAEGSGGYLRHQLGGVALVGFTFTSGASAKRKDTGFHYDE